jgi:predicted phosphodiesterase
MKTAMAKRYGIVSDLHSNLEGLKSCLAALDEEGVDEVLCLGDIVGYNAKPSECMDLVFERCSHVIQGNHDRYLLGEIPDRLKESIVHVAKWGSEQLSDEQRRRLKDLPETEVVDDLVLMVHGSPRNRDEYLLSHEAIAGGLRAMKGKYMGLYVCFFGHTHLPFLISDAEVIADFKERTTIRLERLTPYLLNPGSTGQPRDGFPLAGCGVFDAGESTMTWLRVEYDIKKTQEDVVEAGLDEWFAYRLEAGK